MRRWPGNSQAACMPWRSRRRRRGKPGAPASPGRGIAGPMTTQRLIVLAGLPGSGKSTLAEGLSRALSMPVFSIDPIEAAMWRSGLARDQTGVAAYDVAMTLAGENLRLGLSVIVDAVNPVEAPRAAWRSLADAYRVDLKIIECVCADETVHSH